MPRFIQFRGWRRLDWPAWWVAGFSALSLVAWTPSAPAQESPVAFVGGLILPISGAPITNGVVVVQGKRVSVVGPEGTAIPAGAVRRDVSGKVLMPGFVDTHSHLGSAAGADGSSPIQPEVRVLDALDVRDPSFSRARAGGITTVNVMPGSGHVLSGQTLYLKLRDGRVIDDLLIKLPDGRIAGGLKMANGTNPRKGGAFPGTRGKTMAMARDLYIKGQEYRDKIRAANGDQSKLPPRDLRLEAIVEVLDGKRTVHHHTHRHDDILSVLRLQKEFGFKLVLQHVTDGWMVADEIAKSGLPASVIVLDSPGHHAAAPTETVDPWMHASFTAAQINPESEPNLTPAAGFSSKKITDQLRKPQAARSTY